MVATLTTTDAAYFLGVHPGSVSRLARRYGVTGTPVRRGSSTVTAWPLDGIAVVARAQLNAKGMLMGALADDDAELLELATEISRDIAASARYEEPVDPAKGAKAIFDLVRRYAAGDLLTPPPDVPP